MATVAVGLVTCKCGKQINLYIKDDGETPPSPPRGEPLKLNEDSGVEGEQHLEPVPKTEARKRAAAAELERKQTCKHCGKPFDAKGKAHYKFCSWWCYMDQKHVKAEMAAAAAAGPAAQWNTTQEEAKELLDKFE